MLAVGVAILALAVMFVIDVTQRTDAVRRNYPVIGRFRHIFTTLGEYFRQYFFAMDREEMPFNRAERDWVYKSARGVDNTSAFGSTKSLTPAGTAIFVKLGIHFALVSPTFGFRGCDDRRLGPCRGPARAAPPAGAVGRKAGHEPANGGD